MLVQDVGEIAGAGHGTTVDVELLVAIIALPGKTYPTRKTGVRRVVGAHVPFPDEGGLVARVLEKLGESRERGFVGSVVDHTVGARVSAGQKTRSRWRA